MKMRMPEKAGSLDRSRFISLNRISSRQQPGC